MTGEDAVNRILDDGDGVQSRDLPRARRRPVEAILTFGVRDGGKGVRSRGKRNFLVSYGMAGTIGEGAGDGWGSSCKREHERVINRVPIYLDIGRAGVAKRWTTDGDGGGLRALIGGSGGRTVGPLELADSL